MVVGHKLGFESIHLEAFDCRLDTEVGVFGLVVRRENSPAVLLGRNIDLQTFLNQAVRLTWRVEAFYRPVGGGVCLRYRQCRLTYDVSRN